MANSGQNADVELDEEVNEDMCLKCQHKRDKSSAEFTSAKRKVAFLTATCCVLCVLTISACCCTLYLYTRFQGFRQELVQLVRAQDLEGAAEQAFAEHFAADHDAFPMYGEDLDYDSEKEDSKSSRERRRNKKSEEGRKKKNGGKKDKGKCKKKQMRICDCCKQGFEAYADKKIAELQSELEKRVDTTVKLSLETTTSSNNARTEHQKLENKFSYVSAAHYTTYVDEDFIRETFGELNPDFDNVKPDMEQNVVDEIKERQSTERKSGDGTVMQKFIPEWNGTLHRNREFVTSDSPQTLKVFKEADWIKHLPSEKLFEYDNTTGKFRALHSGLYHLYAHVLFYDAKAKMAIGLSHHSTHGLASESKGKETIVLRCMESVDHVNSELTMSENSRYKSCSVNGVLYLHAGDTVRMLSLYRNTCLDLSKDATYFGGILFSTSAL